MIPPHRAYVEHFGGSGCFLLNKKSSSLEVFNDINSLVINFFKVLVDESARSRLMSKLEYTPWSREMFRTVQSKFKADDFEDDVDRAWAWFVGVRQALGGMAFRAWAIPSAKMKRNNLVIAWRNTIERFEFFAKRLSHVVFENNSFEKTIPMYDNISTFHYIDPPYIGVQRTDSDVYAHEMDISEHEKLLNLITKSGGMFLISGYENDLYEDALKDWKRADIRATNWTKPARDVAKRDTRVETVWFNYPITRAVMQQLSDKLEIVR